MEDPKQAFHGTSLDSGATIIREGSVTGVCATQEKTGVYCEREARKACCLTYAPHTLIADTDSYGLITTAIFELIVDRAVGQTVNDGQWVQPPESIIITGVYTHIASVTSLYDKGYLGWYKIHESVYNNLKLIKIAAERDIAHDTQ